MTLIFLYGPVASGKLTVARALARQTGFALFHNHLVVDAVAPVFPFGSEAFVALRERWWLDMIGAATGAGQSLIFTFAPEPSVAADFPARVVSLVERLGGTVILAALTLDADEQDRRIDAADRARFGKLRDLDLLRALRPECDACFAAMPAPAITIDTGTTAPDDAAARIAALI